MSKKRNLLKELNIENQGNECFTAVDIEKIKSMVNNNPDFVYSKKESVIMKSKKSFVLAASAAVMILGLTVFATGGLVSTWTSHSSSIPEYTELPSAAQCIEDIGYEPVLIEEFSNGYKFKEGSVVKNNLLDDNNKSVEKFNSVTFRYTRGDGRITFSQDKYSSDIETSGSVVSSEEGIDIYYSSYMNKVVPPDYELTDEDKKAEESGELIFSYGSQEVMINKVESVLWKNDGISYLIMQIDGDLSEQELVEMAKEAINA